MLQISQVAEMCRPASNSPQHLVMQCADAHLNPLLPTTEGAGHRAKAFAASADLRERMQESGVIDKPDIYFLNR